MLPDLQDVNHKFNEASTELRKLHDKVKGKSGAGLERRYSTAYQAGVKAGIFPQLKLKYRRA